MTRKLLIIVIAIVLLLLLTGFQAYRALKGQKILWLSQKLAKPSVVNVGDFTTNLNGPGQRFIRVSINLEVSDAKAATKIDSNLPLIRDEILKALRAKTAEDVSADEGMEQLADDILRRLEPLAPEGQITNVWFSDFAVQ